MSVEAAIYGLVFVAFIVVVALVAAWIAGEKMGAPTIVSIIIWGIALLLILAVLLRQTGFLHAAAIGAG